MHRKPAALLRNALCILLGCLGHASAQIQVDPYGVGDLDVVVSPLLRQEHFYSVVDTPPATNVDLGEDGLAIGHTSTGALRIENTMLASSGGFVGTRAGATGHVEITGPAAIWNNLNKLLYVGQSGNGVVAIANGGSARNYAGVVAQDINSVGRVQVDGTGSSWQQEGPLTVGERGAGSLFVSAGGTVLSSNAVVGTHPSSTSNVTVEGAGSTWNSDDITVGDYGDGSLRITAGGQVHSLLSWIGKGTTSTSQVEVSGTASQWTHGNLGIGDDGSGTLSVLDGALVSSLGGIVAREAGSLGKVVVSGPDATWTLEAGLIVGGYGAGSLEVQSGGLVRVSGTLTVDLDASLDSYLDLSSGGMLALTGDSSASITEFLSPVNGATAIRYWDHAAQAWAPIATANRGTDYELQYLSSGPLAGMTLLTVGYQGDFNRDGQVDSRDYAVWREGFATGEYTSSQFAQWHSNFGVGAGSVLAPPSIPEPASGLLLAAALLASSLGRQRSES